MSIVKVHTTPPYGLYWSWDADAPVAPKVGFGWFRGTEPPYHVGQGLRFQVGSKALQIGVCRATGESLNREVPATLDDIGEWVAPEPEEETDHERIVREFQQVLDQDGDPRALRGGRDGTDDSDAPPVELPPVRRSGHWPERNGPDEGSPVPDDGDDRRNLPA